MMPRFYRVKTPDLNFVVHLCFAKCGCKHFTLVIGRYGFRCHFGLCQVLGELGLGDHQQ